MIIVRLSNCIFKGKKKQNTTFFFPEKDFNTHKDDITEQWVLDNLNKITSEITKQEHTKIEIEKI